MRRNQDQLPSSIHPISAALDVSVPARAGTTVIGYNACADQQEFGDICQPLSG